MEEANDEECIAKLFGFKGNNKNKKANKKTTKKKAEIQIVTVEAKAEDSARASNDDGDAASTNRVRISEFDFWVDNFFRDMDTIARLCGEEDAVDFDQSEIQRISSSVTFLREWREFKYPPRSIRFGYGHGSSEGKDVSAINLPQFSSATVPMYDMQKEDHLGDAKSQESRDFVMHVGGPVWALDWCPQIHEKPDCSIKCEFIAVAAHPPGSSYHKMGAPLTGRGVIQIWCLLNIREHNEEVCSLTEKRKKRPKKGGDTNVKSTQIKRPRGRPRKNPIEVPVDDMNCETHNVPALDVQFPEDSTEFPTPDGNLEKNQEIFPTTNKRKRGPKKNEATNEKSGQIKRPRGRPKKNSKEIIVVGTNCENQALSVQVPEDSAEFISPDVTHGNIALQENSVTEQKHGKKAASACNTSSKNEATNEKSGQIKRPRGRPKKNSKEVIAVDTNYDNQAVQALAVKVPEDSAEFMSPDVAHGNIAMQQNSVTKQKHAKKVASACNTSSKNEVTNEKSGQIKKPRGKPKKNSKEIIAVETNCENQAVQALAVQVPEDSVEFISPNVAHGNIASQQNSVTKQKHAKKAAFACNTSSKTPIKISRLKVKRRSYSQDINEPLLTHCENEANHQPHINQPLLTHCEHEANHQPHCSSELGRLAATHSIPGQLTLPRVVSCLAHNGKVAWDVKWRPPNMSDSLCKHRMGYLAVLLGNGSLEVWEVPLPRVLRAIYMHKEGNDPRFIKLEPVFKCSMLKRGGLQSIPLTVEWSVTPPHDYLLAGCHDGTVALWKFSTNASSKCDDTKPVLCFSGDTVPIRAVAWAPFDGDPESSNIIVTAGHEGLKFWDLRNPFRPLRNLHPAPRIIYSLDWLSKPSCIIMSFEDGTMRTISLVKAANDLPFSGKTYTGKKQPGLHSSSYSSFAIWSVQVSRITGMVAYCGADGTVFRFQLTSKAVEKDDSRNRAPYFLCGSVTEKESTLIINTPVSNAPFPLRKSYERARHAQSFRELLSKSNISKNANNQMAKASNSDSQTLALCDGDDLGLESESEEALSSVEQPKRPNLTHSNSKKPVESQTLVCRDDVSTSTLVVDNEKSNFGNIPEVFPSKMVALHRVRWNMNKGSERWLCFGGAGGIVRCQEIVFSNIDKKWALKR